jgi:cytochrome c556
MKIHALLFLLPFAAAAGPVDETPIPDPDVGQHGMVGERLRMIMENISGTVHDTGSVDADRQKLTRDGLDDMVEAVQELMYFAEFMTLNPPRRDLGENQIVTFRALASQLYTEALNVRDIARDYDLATHDFELLNSAYERLYQTCAACHELFRDR